MTYIKRHIFKNAVIKSTSHTSVQDAGRWDHGGDTVLGSEIDYTPISSSSKIIYEISFFFYASTTTNICVNLEQSTDSGVSWSRIADRFGRNVGWAQSDPGSVSGQEYRFFSHFSFIIPAWSGERSLRLRFRQAPQYWNWDAQLHKNYVWDGAAASNKFTNTSVLVHEI